MRREEWLKACASRSTRARSSPSAVRRCSASVRESVSAPTPGCPSMSEPAHEPKPTSRPSARTSNVRSSSSSTSGHRVEQRRLEEEQVAADLVLDHRAHAAHLVGLPQQRHRLAQLAEQHAAAGAADPRVVERVEPAGDAQLVVEHGAARRLRRVRGEHELEVQGAHGGGQVGARLAQQVGGLHQRLALARAGRVVVAAPAHPLALLGDVGELELQRAGADARLHLLVRELLDELLQRGAGGRVAGAQRGGASRAASARCGRRPRRPARRGPRAGPRRAARCRGSARRRSEHGWGSRRSTCGAPRVCHPAGRGRPVRRRRPGAAHRGQAAASRSAAASAATAGRDGRRRDPAVAEHEPPRRAGGRRRVGLDARRRRPRARRSPRRAARRRAARAARARGARRPPRPRSRCPARRAPSSSTSSARRSA